MHFSDVPMLFLRIHLSDVLDISYDFPNKRHFATPKYIAAMSGLQLPRTGGVLERFRIIGNPETPSFLISMMRTIPSG